MPIIYADELRAFSVSLLTAGGFREDHARQTADLLVWANLRGVDSHGVLRIPRYIEMIEEGAIVSRNDPAMVNEFGAVIVMDGGKCPGSVAMNLATEKAAKLAERHGLGWCAMRNISHCGAIGYFTSALAMRGLIGIAMAASKPLMSYYGAKGEALSTNPLSIAIPTGTDTPIVLDMSTAAVALGKIMAAKDAGREIPEGWGVDAEGQPVTDPAKVAAVLPMAGPKGAGLSLMIEMLTSVLAGNPIIAPALLAKKKDGFNGLVIAVDPATFGDAQTFASNVIETQNAIHGLEPAQAGGSVLLPGERGSRRQAELETMGIPLAEGTTKRLAILAQKLGCPVPQVLQL